MYILLIICSLLFITIGIIVNYSNAKYLINGYNSLSIAERDKINIVKYIKFFKFFHIALGFSMFIFGGLIYNLSNEIYLTWFVLIYPLTSYLISYYYYYKNTTLPKFGNTKLLFIIISFTLFFVTGLLYSGFSENEIIVDQNKFEITGLYGEVIKCNEIQRISLVDQLPEINYKLNGFSVGYYKKGYFNTKQNEKVKLFIQVNQNPYILIEKINGEKIYYFSLNQSSLEIIETIKKFMPEKVL